MSLLPRELSSSRYNQCHSMRRILFLDGGVIIPNVKYLLTFVLGAHRGCSLKRLASLDIVASVKSSSTSYSSSPFPGITLCV
jgi:hypothetical protein